ncbi:hypothetical protein B9Z65_6709 [Elsinoe australis]|uniref:Uncharacterized protein n=1 Tax=Elsinoe australis TaxID=40998 RepID=A0A2P8AE15_9PEZI|nr:hypothetical protein B9Z65_6709 [Elsinoe australis]
MSVDVDVESDQEWFDSVFSVEEAGEGRAQRRWSAILRDDKHRIAIKRRKIGKFIGLVNMQTPKEEVESKMRHDMERTVRRLRREKIRREEEELVKGKWW